MSDERNTRTSDDAGRGANSGHDTRTPARGNNTPPVEIGGRQGLDPVRYGDWEKAGRCIDF